MVTKLKNPSLCETFRHQALWTWEQLGRAHSVEARLTEESLTDFNLLEIRCRHKQEVITRTFTKVGESLCGADWEWWFTGRSKFWIGFRVQAKVIDFETQRYEHLHYTSRSGRSQSDLLCERALATSPQCIPIYCMYSYWPLVGQPIPWSSPMPETYGCALVDGFFVKKSCNDPQSRELRRLYSHMVPWHHLVCGEESDLATRVLTQWRSLIKVESGPDDFQLTSEPPPYVRDLLQNGDVESLVDLHLRTVTVFQEDVSSNDDKFPSKLCQ